MLQAPRHREECSDVAIYWKAEFSGYKKTSKSDNLRQPYCDIFCHIALKGSFIVGTLTFSSMFLCSCKRLI